MGLYDYVGHDGYQVKCFYIPCVNVHYNKETRQATVNFYTSGGRLASVNNAPYMTHYYNYGKNFAILDYQLMLEDKPIVHIFKNAKWVETREWNEFEDDYDYPPVTISKYGDWTNIHSAADMKEFVETFLREDARCIQIETDGLEAINLSYKLSDIGHYREMGLEAMQEEFRLRDQIRSEAYNVTLKPFYEKWSDNSRESDISIIGIVLEDYANEQEGRKESWRDFKRHEYEWYQIFTQATLMLREKYDEPIEAYYSWATNQGIEVDRDWMYGLFCKYTVPAPEEVVREYEEYLENRGW